MLNPKKTVKPRKTRQSLQCKAMIESSVPLDSTMNVSEETVVRRKYRDVVLEVAEISDFSFHDLECLVMIFDKLNKSGHRKLGIKKPQLIEILHYTLDMTDDNLNDRIFQALTQQHSLYMSLENWVKSLSFLLKGSLEDKIKYCYGVYDVTGDQLINKKSIFKWLKHSIVSRISEEDGTVEAWELVNDLIRTMDTDRDRKISLSDFTKSVQKHPLLLEAFGQCLPLRTEIMTFLATFTDGPVEL